MKYFPVSSSNIESVGFDEDREILGVKYLNGTEYHYIAVPKSVFDGLLRASSPGRFLNEEVKATQYKFIQVR